MIDFAKNTIEPKLKELVSTCSTNLNEYSEFGMHYIEPSVNTQQVLNTISAFLEVKGNEIVSVLKLNELEVVIKSIYKEKVYA